MKKSVCFILVCCLTAGLVALLTACSFDNALDVNLNDYVQFKFSGVNGKGTAEYAFDTDLFEKDYGDNFSVKDNSETFVVDTFADYISVSGSFNKDYGLSNGDEIVFSWDLDPNEIERQFNVSLSYKDIDLVVEGLKDPYINVVDFNCDKDGKTLYLNTGEDLLFTVEIDTNIDISDDVLLFMTNNDDEFLLFGMNDEGENGDAEAGDGIYSVCLTNAIATSGVRMFYVDVNGTQSATVVDIIFTEDPHVRIEETEEAEGSEEAKVSDSDIITVEPEESVGGYRNAAEDAKAYIENSALSYEELVNRLEQYGYTAEEAVFGADYCEADWDEQALKRARQYLDVSAYSYSGLRIQLVNNGFTEEEALYAVNNCGADWYDQAFKRANGYLDMEGFNSNKLVNQLEYEGFTIDESSYGAEQAELYR